MNSIMFLCAEAQWASSDGRRETANQFHAAAQEIEKLRADYALLLKRYRKRGEKLDELYKALATIATSDSDVDIETE